MCVGFVRTFHVVFLFIKFAFKVGTPMIKYMIRENRREKNLVA